MTGIHVEVEGLTRKKGGEQIAGDRFLSRRREDTGRVLAVLSDGLGSGVKAGVLSTLTATMALRCMEGNVPAERTARIIMKTLPLCRERQIRYATFSMVDIDPGSGVRVWEYDNPQAFLVREGRAVELDWTYPREDSAEGGQGRLRAAFWVPREGDRLVLVSDGVTQSGMGSAPWPLGWGGEELRRLVHGLVEKEPDISARMLARRIVQKAHRHDGERARDDISAGVIYFRQPRRLILATGPPFHPERDRELAERLAAFPGRRIICGGTTASLVARELGRRIETPLKGFSGDLPPVSSMEGFHLITEGILTLGRLSPWLAQGLPEGVPRDNPARQVYRALQESDQITLLAGTRINEAHQDPNLPVELEIRRNMVKRLAEDLKGRHLKEVTVEYI